jgi:hypothetical protein
MGAVGVAPAMGRLSRAVMGKVKNEERERVMVGGYHVGKEKGQWAGRDADNAVNSGFDEKWPIVLIERLD